MKEHRDAHEHCHHRRDDAPTVESRHEGTGHVRVQPGLQRGRKVADRDLSGLR